MRTKNIDTLTIPSFLSHKLKEGCEKKYLSHCEMALKFFFSYCEKHRIAPEDLTLEDCQRIQQYLVNRHISSRGINGYISVLRVFYNYLMLNEQVSINPFLLLASLKVVPVAPTWVPISEIKKIFYKIDSGMFIPMLHIAIFECMYGTGMKAVELLNLRERDYDAQTESLLVRSRKVKKIVREVPLPAGSIYILKHYITFRKLRYPMAKYLFVTKTGKQLTHRFIAKATNDLLMATSTNGKGVNLIKFSYRAHLIKAGAKIENVARLIGGIPATLVRFDEISFAGRMKQIHSLCHPKG